MHQYEKMKEDENFSKQMVDSEEKIKTLQLKLEEQKKRIDRKILVSLNPYAPEMKNSIESIAWNYDDTKVAIACFGEKIMILDNEFQVLDKIDEYQEGKISWHKKKNILAFLGSNKSLKFYQVEGRKIIRQIPLEHLAVSNNSFLIDWHPNEDLFAFHTTNSPIKICNMIKITTPFGIETVCKDLKWNTAGDKFAYSTANMLVVMSFYQNKCTEYFKITEKEAKNTINNIIWSRDDQRICFLSTSGSLKRIKIWNVEEEVEESNFGSIFSNIISIDWSSDEKYIVAGGAADKFITIWSVEHSIELFSTKIVSENSKEDVFVKWNNSASILTSYTRKKFFPYIWNEKFNFEPLIVPFKEKVEKSIWSSDGSRLLISFDKSFKIWDMTSRILVQEFKNLNSTILHAIWNNSFTEVVCLTEDEVYYQDLALEEPKKIEYENDNGIHLIRYNHDCSLIAGAGNKIIEIWNANFKQDRFQLKFFDLEEAHARNIIDVRWNKNGTKLLSTSNDETVKLWELDLISKTAKNLLVIKKHGGPVHWAMWDESENHIISVGKDQYIRIFSVVNGRELKSINTDDDSIKYMGWFTIFNENFLIYLHPSNSSFHLIDLKTGLPMRDIQIKADRKQENIPIRHFDCNKFNQKIVVSLGNNVMIYDNQEIYKDFETNEYYYFLIEFLPKRLTIKLEYSSLIEKMINHYFFKEAPSAFHILCIHKKVDEFDKLIQFCIKKKIFCRRFYDNDEHSLFNLLNLNMPQDSINLFFDFAIQSDVPLGNLFKVNTKDLTYYTQKNSLKVSQFLESRFKILETYEILDAEWPSEDVKHSTGLTKCLNFKEKSDFSQAFGNVLNLKTINDSSKRPYLKVLDIPVIEVSLNYIKDLSESGSFNEFCQTDVIVSILNLLWYKGVLTDFLKKNILYFIYFLILILNSIIVLPGFLSEIEDTDNPESKNGAYQISFLILSIVLACLLIIMFTLEIMELVRLKQSYFKSFWNYIDLTNIIFSFSCIIFNIVVLSGHTDELGLLRIFHSLCFFFSMVRIFDFFRAFRETCFLIQIVLQVVYDMRIFFILMMIFVSTFSLSSTQK